MGLTAFFLTELVELKRSGLIPGRRVVEIGAHQLSNQFLRAEDDLNEIYRLYDAERAQLGSAADALDGPEMITSASPQSRLFWQSLGFSYEAFEYGGRHGVTAFDLNSDTLPSPLRGAFDLLVNAGTTEHVFDQHHAFRVMHDLVTVGGIMIHTGPSHGWALHGLYQYGLKFFWKLSEANGYEISRLQLMPWCSRPVPPSVIESNARWGSSRYPALPAQLLEIGYIAVLRKHRSEEFHIPLDV